MLTAIIGGIGSGKSTLLKKYADDGYSVIDADEVNKVILKDKNYIAKLSFYFPSAIKADGLVDTKILKNIIFNDDSKRILLNELSHSLIMEKILEYAKNKQDVYVEMPVFSASLKNYFQKIIYVDCDYETRKKRVMARDRIDETMFELINNAQFNEEELKELATEVFYNG